MLAIIKIISKSSAAWKAVFVYSCGSSLKFSPKDHGRPDPRTWRRASRAAAAGKMVKLCQIRQNPEIVAKKSICFLFAIYFRFFVFFSDCFFRFCFRFLSVFLVFESNLTKSKNCKKRRVFLSPVFFRFFHFFSIFFVFFPNYFRVPKTIFSLFSNYFRLKKESLNYFRTWSTFWFRFRHYQCDCHSDLRDPGKICCNKLKVMFWERSVTMEN